MLGIAERFGVRLDVVLVDPLKILDAFNGLVVELCEVLGVLVAVPVMLESVWLIEMS
jgi:hypothetical protein